MKRYFKIFLPVFFLLFLSIFIPIVLHADPIGGGCDPLDPKCPVDGGLTALLIIGAGYGIKKVRDSRKAEE